MPSVFIDVLMLMSFVRALRDPAEHPLHVVVAHHAEMPRPSFLRLDIAPSIRFLPSLLMLRPSFVRLEIPRIGSFMTPLLIAPELLMRLVIQSNIAVKMLLSLFTRRSSSSILGFFGPHDPARHSVDFAVYAGVRALSSTSLSRCPSYWWAARGVATFGCDSAPQEMGAPRRFSGRLRLPMGGSKFRHGAGQTRPARCRLAGRAASCVRLAKPLRRPGGRGSFALFRETRLVRGWGR
jgi:hypothetical protein